MPLQESHLIQLQSFFDQSHFSEQGAVITDLDGTAIHEFQGHYSIPKEVEYGLKGIYDLGRPVVLNTLRFPLSVMRTFARDWYAISNRIIPTVLMNGSQLGYIFKDYKNEFYYEEIAAYPLLPEEIDPVLSIVQQLINDGMEDLLVFFYPRNWTKGEIIWTPMAARTESVHQKYRSASSVISGNLKELEGALKKEDICMIFLLIDIPQDKLMAYQHTKKSNFFTHKGVDKRFGAQELAKFLGFDLLHSVGAGDSEMDSFLTAVGLPVHVGNLSLSFTSKNPPIKVQGSNQLGELLFELAALQKTTLKN